MTASQGWKPAVGWLPVALYFKEVALMSNLEDFNKLTDEEKEAILSLYQDNKKKLSDQEAQIKSLTTELDDKNTLYEESKKELAKTKELNYTLARKVDQSTARKSFEETLHDCFMKKGE